MSNERLLDLIDAAVNPNGYADDPDVSDERAELRDRLYDKLRPEIPQED